MKALSIILVALIAACDPCSMPNRGHIIGSYYKPAHTYTNTNYVDYGGGVVVPHMSTHTVPEKFYLIVDNDVCQHRIETLQVTNLQYTHFKDSLNVYFIQ